MGKSVPMARLHDDWCLLFLSFRCGNLAGCEQYVLQSRLCLLCVAKIYKNPQLSQLLAAYCVTINYVNLQIYRPYDARYPVVCMDEKPMQLLADARKGDAKRTVPIFKTANTSETEHAVSSCLPSLSPGSAMLRLWSIVRRLTGPDR